MSWRNTSDYRNWRSAVLEKDQHKCVLTGLTNHLHAHHLNNASYFKEERFDVSNGVTVHKLVHLMFHILFMKGYRKKCTKKDWKKFVRLFKYVIKLKKLMK